MTPYYEDDPAGDLMYKHCRYCGEEIRCVAQGAWEDFVGSIVCEQTADEFHQP